MPVYHVEKYIRKSLLSALDQDFMLPYEILIVDDCGTDRSMEIVNELIAQHPSGDKVRIIRHDKNLGIGEARNTIIRNAKGKYLFFLDPDDWIFPNSLSILYAKAEETQAEITCGSFLKEYENTGEQTDYYRYKDKTYEHESVGVWMLSLGIKMANIVWNNLYRMDFLRKNNIHAIHRICEDHWLSYMTWFYAKKITRVSTVTLCYNVREDSIMTSMLGKKGTDDSARELCDDIIQLGKLIESKFHHVDGAYDLYYANIKSCVTHLITMLYTEEQSMFIKSQLKKTSKKVPSIRCLHSNRFRFIYLCSCLYDNGYSYYHYDALYTKLQRYFPKLLKG